jgi:hypothetical protein
MCMPKYRKLMTKNVLSKLTIYMIKTQFYTILMFLIPWSTFILILCQNTFSFNHYQTHNVLSHLFPLALCAYKSQHNIFIIAKITQNIQFMIYETKNEIKRRLNTMHTIKMTPSWLFNSIY